MVQLGTCGDVWISGATCSERRATQFVSAHSQIPAQSDQFKLISALVLDFHGMIFYRVSLPAPISNWDRVLRFPADALPPPRLQG